MANPLSWNELTSQPASGDVLDVFTIVYAVVFIVGFVASAYVYYRPWTKPFGAMFRRKAVIRASGMAMWLFGIGVFFFLIRLLQINPFTFGEPVWMWLSLVAIIVLAVAVWMNWHRGRLPVGKAQDRPRTTAPTVNRPVRRDRAHR